MYKYELYGKTINRKYVVDVEDLKRAAKKISKWFIEQNYISIEDLKESGAIPDGLRFSVEKNINIKEEITWCKYNELTSSDLDLANLVDKIGGVDIMFRDFDIASETIKLHMDSTLNIYEDTLSYIECQKLINAESDKMIKAIIDSYEK